MENACVDDWQYYRSLACWEPLDAARLLFKFKNSYWPNDEQTHKALNAISELYRKGMIEHSTVALEEIPRHNFYRKDYSRFILDIGDWEYIVYPKARLPSRKLLVVFLPITFIRWVKHSLGYEIPSELEIEAIERGPFDSWQTRCRFKNLEKQREHKKKTIPLEKSAAQKLGRLEKQNKNWDESLKAIIAIVRWTEAGKYKITRSRLKQFMKENFPNIEGYTINKKLWAAIPENLKNSGSGNPKETIKNKAE